MRSLFILLIGVAIGVAGVALLRPRLNTVPIQSMRELTPMEQAVERIMPDLIIEDAPLDDILSQISKASGVRVFRDPTWTHTDYNLKTLRLTFHWRSRALHDVLDDVADALQPSSRWSPRTGWFITGNDIALGDSYGTFNASSVTRLYAIDDLLQPADYARRPLPDSDKPPSTQPVLSDGREVAAMLLIGAVRDILEARHRHDLRRIPDDVAVRYRFGRLVVTGNYGIHEDVRRLLAEFRLPPPPAEPRTPPPLAVRWNPVLRKWTDADSLQTEDKLRQPLRQFQFQGPRDAALQQWSKQTGIAVTMQASPQSRDPGPSRELARPVSVSLQNAAAGDVMLAILATESDELTWVYDGATINIDRRDAIDPGTAGSIVRRYDVRNELQKLQAFAPPQAVWEARKAAAAAAGEPMDSPLLFSPVTWAEYSLALEITRTLDPYQIDSNVVSGNIRVFGGQFIVTTTAEKHYLIRRFLETASYSDWPPKRRPPWDEEAKP